MERDHMNNCRQDKVWAVVQLSPHEPIYNQISQKVSPKLLEYYSNVHVNMLSVSGVALQ